MSRLRRTTHNGEGRRWPLIVSLILLVAACTESGLDENASGGVTLAAEDAKARIEAFPPLCEALRSDGYETRKSTFDDASETDLMLAEKACPADIQRLQAARNVEAATAKIDPAKVVTSFTDCSGTTTGFVATVKVTNNTPVPVGVYLAVRAEAAGEQVGSAELAVVWKIEPGASASRDIEGEADGGDGCEADFNMFLADGKLAGDGAGINPVSPELGSDDSGVWVPALHEAETAWWNNPEAPVDGPATTEDLRSVAYQSLLSSVIEGEPRPPMSPFQSLCRAAARSDNPGLAAVTVQYGDGIAAGVVRRGNDGAWRWLGSPLRLGPGPGCP